ncbi:MAG: LysR family transcriptional regulator [Hydrogenophaga sp.]|jgi:DNA-binding transcriptional LysR family regulator|uniref:LysR family transcriptional regulator n=1 Tax=Hydrogenophaga sp. TaxID=1904254 RepID=UPI0025C2BCBD|nr:LysR family transcriptional regulator [Hydrogenophaga sp.]MDO9133126.1 LysR family transcriptional regulator [Hydrogenophaga sp.]MDO9505138.1 LysR family transcriptional regulator [Hydrogenophaga sp.]MDP2075971.1 LysR family transcriptional regulator [Hydrogenophaga sp.]MDP3109233.1 LysR family transcriptional regulator [Hydrogenophaga sp.]MDP3204135.1 LysR family transcriptional regulator [Hydrogenophaga sp.]
MDRLVSMRVFQKVIDEGGFAAAGRSMDMSPAVVTRLVADLEEHLGTRLLHRTTRRVSLTDAGESYLERVRVILQDLDEAHALVSSQTSELAGVLRLLAPPVLATHVLAPLVSGFRQAYPKILLDIDVESHREPPIEDYDITLMGTKASFDANVIARKVLSSVTVLLASPEYLRRRGTPARPEDLAQHDCLRFKPAAGRSRGWRLLHEADEARFVDIEVQPVLWANHTDTLMHAALDGAGITATTIELAAPLIQNGDLVRVLNPWITDRLTMYAALPSRKFMPRRTEVFLDYLITQTRTRVESAMATCSNC